MKNRTLNEDLSEGLSLDEALRRAYSDEVQPDIELQRKTLARMQRKMEEKKMVQKIWKLTAAAALGLVLLGAVTVTGYASANGLSFHELLATVFSKEGTERLAEMSYDLDVEVKKDSFKEINIMPIEAISDGYISWFVVKVEGKNGYELKNPVYIDEFDIRDEEDSTSSAGSKFLKMEDGAAYYAIEMTGKRKKKRDTIPYTLRVQYVYEGVQTSDSLVERKLDQNGEPVLKYAGAYQADISCKVNWERAFVDVNGVDMEISSLGMFIHGDFAAVGAAVFGEDISDLRKQHEAFDTEASISTNLFWQYAEKALEMMEKGAILLSDRKEVQLDIMGGTEGEDGITDVLLNTPINPKDVTGIRLDGKVFAVK